MNLAKYVTWDTLIGLSGGLLFGISAGNYFNSFTVGCWVFSAAQYLFYNFTYLTRIDLNLKILLMRSDVKADLESTIAKLEAMRKEVKENADRDR
jgi:hypothetical protein